MARPDPIQLDATTWIIMREHPTRPKAIVHCVTDTSGEARYLLMVWHVDPAKRRMHGIYTSLSDADLEVRWDNSAARQRASDAVGPFQGYPNMRNMPRPGEIKLAPPAQQPRAEQGDR